MAVATDVQTGLFRVEQLADPGGVAPGIPANVGDKNRKPLDRKELVEGKAGAQLGVVDITINCSDGFGGFKLVQNYLVSNVSSVPYLITIGEVFEYPRV